MRIFLTLIVLALVGPMANLYGQTRHIALPVNIQSQLVQTLSLNQNRSVTALQRDTLFFSSPDSLYTYATSFGGSTTVGVFLALPDSLFPVRITTFVVNFYGGNSHVGNELSQASVKAIIWDSVAVPTDIQPDKQIRETFNQTVSVSTDQYRPFTFSFSDTSRIMKPGTLAVGLQYSGIGDTVSAVSPVFGKPPVVYNEFFIDSTASGSDTTANYYDHQSYWKNPDQVGGISGWLLLEHDPAWVQTAVEKRPDIPSRISILSNYPNPFNPTTQLIFESRSSGKADLEIYDILGRIVYKKSYQVHAGQTYHWLWVASDYHSGVYIARVHINDQMVTRKMMLLK